MEGLPLLTGLEPMGRSFGFDRGTAIDRHYIEQFLERHAGDLRGRVLEVGDAGYIRRFGTGAIERVDVLNAEQGTHPDITLVGDLATGSGVPEETFDAMIVTQTLQYIFDVRAAVAGIHRALRPGGVALVTLPGIAQISPGDMESWGDFWRFTDASARRLFAECFAADGIQIGAHGNALIAAAFLYGLAREEIPPQALEHHDCEYQVLITVRVTKAVAAAP